MRIDQTRIKAFWQNPERYRLQYELDFVPHQMAYGLARGIAFHTTLDLVSLGRTPQEIEDILAGRTPDQYGRILKLGRSAVENGFSMAKAYLDQDKYIVLASESEFDFGISGSEHRGVGRIDRLIWRSADSYEQWLQEFKTASIKAQENRKLTDWSQDIQADMEILGARSLGYDPVGVEVQYVVEKDPPELWEPMRIRRTEGSLKRTMLKIHQTCETILMYRKEFGINRPWPHLPNMYPCWGTGEKCEYSDICQSNYLERELIPLGFQRREEHLVVLQGERHE